ncbi:hypothetical protein BJV77DRAFT_1014930 [Russula vinacea]|nr:hypothetical protein BJV77DRAFT_1014930 [Russula vinacea]
MRYLQSSGAYLRPHPSSQLLKAIKTAAKPLSSFEVARCVRPIRCSWIRDDNDRTPRPFLRDTPRRLDDQDEDHLAYPWDCNVDGTSFLHQCTCQRIDAFIARFIEGLTR